MFIYFAGICGTAMASAAVALKQRGHQIIGSDANVYPPMSDFLLRNGINILTGYREENISSLSHTPDLVVIGNALSRGNSEVEYILNRRLKFTSLPELLKNHFISGKRSIVVCGTHGKTTTTSLLTWVFEHSNQNPSYLIGGIPSNFTQGARFTESPWFIIEGDEYDTAFFDKRSKFIHYTPEITLINNLEFDHADIFENLAAIKKTFRHLINTVPNNGLVLYNGDDLNLRDITRGITFCPLKSFGLGPENDFRAIDCIVKPEESHFTLGNTTYTLPRTLSGELNIRNALGVASCALHCGLTPTQIQSSFDTFLGIRRRMEEVGTQAGITIIDDFGHHPTAISETLLSLRARYPKRRIWAAFEPRSNTTRRNIFQKEIADALSLSDGAVIAAVAREEALSPELRLNPAKVAENIRSQAHIPAAYFHETEDIIHWLLEQTHSGDVICFFSNGKFDSIHQRILQALRKKSFKEN